MFLVLDENLQTERSVQINDCYENLSDHGQSLTAVYRVHIPSEDPVQNVSELAGAEFRTINIEDADGHEVPVQGTYNAVQAISAAFNEDTGEYSITIAIGWRAAPDEQEGSAE